ncbi:hypothetical protein D1159_05450 [Pseudoflavonifractor sp. 524-17]|uniref:hypothetical protein n=1 Tax=Pseudoflavonifractor sp. 524-17 TaxID=2304577 RepID=UPI001379CDE2|nr:hypothetical protein [Pseudoflavonifractor sp. 524-17]NCE64046.1 hypothetical protein [Pseudoflavonifractor sp. 524-17]
MKQHRRIPALLLVLSLMCTLLLSGCQGAGEKPAQPDAVAQVFYDLIIRQDASSAKELFGYTSEEEAMADLIGDAGDFEKEMVSELSAQFEDMGLELTDEEITNLYNAIISMLDRLSFSAEIKEISEKDKTAVVIAHIGYYDSATMTTAMENALNSVMPEDPSSITTEAQLNEILHNYLAEMCNVLATLQPASGTKDFEVDFELTKMEINGKEKAVWMPSDPEQFGMDLSTNAMSM